MRRGSLTKSNSEITMSGFHETSSIYSNGSTEDKRTHRKCECCQSKHHHDYLRQQRQSREKRLFRLRQSAKVIVKEDEAQIHQTNTSERQNQNHNPNVSQTKHQSNQEYLIKKSQQQFRDEAQQSVKQETVVQNQKDIKLQDNEQEQDIANLFQKQLSLIQQSRGQQSPLFTSPIKYTPVQKKRYSLSSILQVQNSSFSPPHEQTCNSLKMSLSITIDNKTYFKQWRNKEQIVLSLQKISQILSNNQ